MKKGTLHLEGGNTINIDGQATAEIKKLMEEGFPNNTITINNPDSLSYVVNVYKIICLEFSQE